MSAHSQTGRWVSLALALVVLFLGIALFTPLHKHQRGKVTRCSLDGLESAFTQAAEEAVEIALLPVAVMLASDADPAVAGHTAVAALCSRAPPSFS
jgi:hypothetical protein